MRNLFKNHKLEAGILLGSLIPTILIISFYIYFFRGNTLSGDPANWAYLGDYVGGLLGPIFGYLSFLLLVFTLKLSHKEKESIERREKKEEWLSLVKHVEALIKEYLDQRVEALCPTDLKFMRKISYEKLLVDVVYSMKTNCFETKNPNAILKRLIIYNPLTVNDFSKLATHFESYAIYLEKYSNYLLETDPAIIDHYFITYDQTIVALDQINMLTKESKNIYNRLGMSWDLPVTI